MPEAAHGRKVPIVQWIESVCPVAAGLKAFEVKYRRPAAKRVESVVAGDVGGEFGGGLGHNIVTADAPAPGRQSGDYALERPVGAEHVFVAGTGKAYINRIRMEYAAREQQFSSGDSRAVNPRVVRAVFRGRVYVAFRGILPQVGYTNRPYYLADCQHEVREARCGDPARLLRRVASRNHSPKITGIGITRWAHARVVSP